MKTYNLTIMGIMLLLFPLATMFRSGNIFAADPPKSEYEAAMSAIEDGKYYLVTEVGETKWYLTQDGYLTDDMEKAYLYDVSKESGGDLYNIGILLEPNNGAHYSNTTLDGTKANLHPYVASEAHYRQELGNNRKNWERQVFYLKDGKFAIRSCNTQYAESGYKDAGRAFWIYEVAETDGGLFVPIPCYDYEPAYVWMLVTFSVKDQVANILQRCINTYFAQHNGTANINIGTDVGQYSDEETWKKFKALLNSVEELLESLQNPDYDYDTDPNACTIEQAKALRAEVDLMWKKFLDSEVLPEGISFADTNVKAICLSNWDTNGDRVLSLEEAAAVTEIGSVFKSNHEITSFDELRYFTGLKNINSYAFQDCIGLTSVTIPNSVTSINYNAFQNCASLTSFIIPNSVTTIDGSAFSGCTNLTSVDIDCSEVGNWFKEFTSLQDVTFGENVSSIGSYAFSYCTGLTSITIPNSVKSIGNYAFYKCTGLTSVTIPNSVTSIGYYAFDGCTNLTSVKIDCSEVGNWFKEFTSLQDVTFGENVSSIGGSAFSGCTGLTSINIPNRVTNIGSYAFSGCTGLTSINIPNSVTSIESGAFDNCTSLISATIPSSVTDIGNNLFWACTSLTSVSINCSNVKGFSGLTSLKDVILGENVSCIGDNAFWGCTGLTSITIPNSVTAIGDEAFSGCLGLISIAIPNSVTTIGYRAFSGCTGLSSITIPNSVTSLGRYMFSGCMGELIINSSIPNQYILSGSKFSSVKINGETICEDAFINLTSISTIELGNEVKSIGNHAFEKCYGLTSIIIPNGVRAIGNSAFYECTGLTSITIPESVKEIGNSVFYGCSGELIINCNIPYSLLSGSKFSSVKVNGETIASGAFNNLTSISAIDFGEGVKSIGSDAFNGCTGLTKVSFASLKSLCGISFGSKWGHPWYYAKQRYVNGEEFKDEKIIIPEGVTSISNYVFCHNAINTVSIPSTVQSIGENAFSLPVGANVLCYATNPPELASNAFGSTDNRILYVPRTSMDTYKITEGWKGFRKTRGYTVYGFNIYAIDDIPSLTKHNTYVSHPVYYDYDGDGVMEMYSFYTKLDLNSYSSTQSFGLSDNDGLIRSLLPFESRSDYDEYNSLVEMIRSNNIPRMSNGKGDLNIGNYIIQSNNSVLDVSSTNSVLSFADIDNDGRLDAIENSSSMLLQMDDDSFFNITPRMVVDSTLLQHSVQGQDRAKPASRRRIIGMSYAQALSMNNVVSCISSFGTSYSERFSTIDLNGDGRLDLLTSDRKSAYMSAGENAYCPVDFVGEIFPYDLDGNGISDYLVYDGNNVYTMICNPSGGATKKRIFENKSVKKFMCRDFDHDGDVDVLVYIIDEFNTYFVFLRNDGNGAFKKKESYIEDKWDLLDLKDFDGDGLYETLVRSSENKILKINKDYTITPVFEQLVGEMNQMLIHFGDYDNDGYTDFKLVDGSYLGYEDLYHGKEQNVNTGISLRTGRYPKQVIQNTAPEKMEKPVVTMDENTGFLRIIWERGRDAETSACDLTYEVRIGTEPGKGDVLCAPSLADGRRRVVADGAMGTQLQTLFNISKHPEGTYYIAVQAIDAGGLGGAWSDETVYNNKYNAPQIIVENTTVSTADTIVVKASTFDNDVSYHWTISNGEVIEQDGREAKVVFHAAGKQQVLLTSVKNDVEYVSEPLSFSVKAYKGNTYIDDRKIEYNVMNSYSNLYLFDINQDGYPDGIGNYVFQWNDGKGNLSKYPKSFNTDLSLSNPKILDLNRDGFPDVIGSYSDFQKGNVFINDEEGDFEYEKRQIYFYDGSDIRYLNLRDGEFVDFTNSGFNDFICNEGLLASNDYTTFDKIPMEYFYNCAMCDINRDGYTDIVFSDVSSYHDYENYYAFINQGNRTFYKITMLEREYSRGLYKIADFNNDGIMDIIGSIPYSTNLGIYLGKFENDAYSWNLAKTVNISFNIADIVIQDFDNNGHLDLEIINKNSNNWHILYFDESLEYCETVLSSLDKYGYNYNLPFVVMNDNGYPLLQLSTIKNEKPKAPSIVSVRQTAEGMVINWSDAEDDHTPGVQMRYNVSVKRKGKTGPDSYLISPMNGGDGNAALVFPWYYKQSTTMTVPNSALTAGETYEVQVQAIDLWNQWSPMTEPVEITISADGGMIDVPDLACVGRETTIKYTGVLNDVSSIDFGTDSQYTRDGNNFIVTWSSEGLKEIAIGKHNSQVLVMQPIDVSFTIPSEVFVGASLPVSLSKEMIDMGSKGNLSFVSCPKGARTSVNYSPTEGKAWLTFDKPGYYEVEANCIDEVRGNSMRLSFEAQNAPVTEIKSVDVSDGHYTVGWNTADLPNSVNKVIIYKEGNRLNQFNVLDTVDVSIGQYVDRTSSSSVMSERYKIGLLSEGGQLFESKPHKPLHVMITTSVSGGYNILWNAYEGLTVDNYRIWRGTSPDNLVLLAQMAGSQQSFTDSNAPSDEIYYAVSFSPVNRASVKSIRRASYAGGDVCSNVVSTRSASSMVLANSLSIVTLIENPSLTEDNRTLQLYSILLPTYCTYNKVAWSIVEGEELADISSNGLLTAKEGRGNVRVRVSTLDGSDLTDEITVYVNVPEYIDPDVLDSVDGTTSSYGVSEIARYDLNGRKLSAPQRGINIIRMSDGTIRKILVK